MGRLQIVISNIQTCFEIVSVFKQKTFPFTHLSSNFTKRTVLYGVYITSYQKLQDIYFYYYETMKVLTHVFVCSFREGLKKIGVIISERNRSLDTPYGYLHPDSIPNSISAQDRDEDRMDDSCVFCTQTDQHLQIFLSAISKHFDIFHNV